MHMLCLACVPKWMMERKGLFRYRAAQSCDTAPSGRLPGSSHCTTYWAEISHEPQWTHQQCKWKVIATKSSWETVGGKTFFHLWTGSPQPTTTYILTPSANTSCSQPIDTQCNYAHTKDQSDMKMCWLSEAFTATPCAILVDTLYV